jgi:transposase
VIGGVAGALATANSYKMRTLVRKTQAELQAKLDQMMDEKIRAMETMTDEIKAETAQAAENGKAAFRQSRGAGIPGVAFGCGRVI